MTSKPSDRSQARYAGLDGMRAIAVTLVVAYHLFPQSWVRGGFIGVDVFFVISGFLITTLLLREHASTGRIALLAFWQRRARRLIPALVAVVIVCATAAWFIGGDVLVRLGDQVLGAATFSYNWVSVAGGGGYFSAATPELFRNFWSLAVEEQFYVLWPLVLPLFLLLPRAWGRAAATLGLAAASAVWMGVTVASAAASGGDLTRAYFGTDTHAFGILLGIAVAFMLESVLSRARGAAAGSAGAGAAADVQAAGLPAQSLLAPGWKVVLPPSGWTVTLLPSGPSALSASNSRVVRLVTGVAGTAGIAGIVALALLPPAASAVTFPGVVGGASILSAVAIVAGVWPGSAFGPTIDAQPLRWIGDRSYGIYLWHWPLLVLLVAAFTRGGPDAGVPLWIGCLTLALTIVAAELSYRFIETPVRRYGFRGSFARVTGRMVGTPTARVRAIAGVSAAVLLLGGTSAAIAAAPDVSSGQAAVEAGLDALEGADESGSEGSSGSSEPGSSGSEDADAGTPSPPPDPAAENPMPVPSPTPVRGDEISAIGDSVMLASAPGLYDRLPGIQVDAAVSRSTWAGPGILESLASGGQLRPYVVVALGTNGPLDLDSMEAMARIAGPDRHLVLVNASAPRDWIPGVNADIAAFAASHPGVVVADWSGAIAGRTDLLAGDQIHPDSGGALLFAETVASAVDQAEQNRANAQYQVELSAYRRLHHAEVRVPQ